MTISESLPAIPISASKSPAVSRAIAVLRYLGASRAPVGVNAIARDLQIVPSSCLHILRALEAEGLVQSSQIDLRYSLSSQLVRMARRALSATPGVNYSMPLLQALAESFSTSVALMHVGSNGYSTVLAAVHPVDSYGLVIETGRRAAAYAGASGRCVVAAHGLTRDQARLAFAKLPWSRPPSFQAWYAQVKECMVRGFAIDDGHYVQGFVNTAAPVLKNGALWRTVVSVSAKGQLAETERAALIDRLTRTAKLLSVSTLN